MDGISFPIDVVLFGGAFDPPHQGHVDCLIQGIRRFPLAEFWVVPTYASPSRKDGKNKISSAGFEHRFAMCQRAFANQPRTQVLRLEERLPSPNFTVATLTHLCQQYPHTNFALLLGQDQLAGFPTWKSPDKILELASLVVIRRGVNSMRTDTDVMLKSLGLGATWKARDALHFDNIATGIILIDGVVHPAQSTLIREGVANAPARWLPEQVLQYIKDQNLYS